MAALIVPKEYGYVLGVLVLTGVVNQYQGFLVGRERRRAGVAYPAAYAPSKEAATDLAKYRFNCAQRAHQNYLEHLPTLLVTAAIGGLAFPVASAAFAALWLAGRIVYAHGYINSTLDQKGVGRYKGGWYVIGQLGLLGTAGCAVYETIAAA